MESPTPYDPRAAAEALAAVPALRVRLVREGPAAPTITVGRPDALFPLLFAHLGDLDREELVAILLDIKNRVLGLHTVAIGGPSRYDINIGMIFKVGLLMSASQLIIVHNHPGHVPDASAEDLAVSREVVQAGDLLDLLVLDHLIVGGERVVSLRRQHPNLFLARIGGR